MTNVNFASVGFPHRSTTPTHHHPLSLDPWTRQGKTPTASIHLFHVNLFVQFYLDATCPMLVLPAPRTPVEPLTPPTSHPLASPAGQVSVAGGRESPSLFDSWSRKSKIRSSFTMPALREDSQFSERMSRLQQEKQMLMEEVKAQKVINHCDPVVEEVLRSVT